MTMQSLMDKHESVQVNPNATKTSAPFLRYCQRRLALQQSKLEAATLVVQRDDALAQIAHYKNLVQMLEVGA